MHCYNFGDAQALAMGAVISISDTWWWRQKAAKWGFVKTSS
jgi:hypothetical protein